MRKGFVVLAVLVLVALAMAPIPAMAQDVEMPVSDGCTAFADFSTTGATINFTEAAFFEYEALIVTVTGSGETFTVLANGSEVLDPVEVGETLVYFIPADGNYEIVVEVTGSDGSSTVTTNCVNTEEVDPIVLTGGAICHIPPGNPDNAHTIYVGPGAIAAHLAHGDTIGPCPGDVESRDDDYEDGIIFFVGDDDLELYGFCDDDDECAPIVYIDFTLLVIEVDFEIEFDDDDDDGYTVVIYYLHPFPDEDDDDDDVHVFQVNIYLNDTLINDNILLFIGEDGELVAWASHDVWENLDEFRAIHDDL